MCTMSSTGRRFAITLVTLAAFGAAMVAGALGPTPSGGGWGIWEPTGSSGSCPGSLVCAEWEDELSIYLCCIDPSDLFTTSLNACNVVVGFTLKQRDSP